jgi:hypothetical protein
MNWILIPEDGIGEQTTSKKTGFQNKGFQSFMEFKQFLFRTIKTLCCQ